MNTINKRQNDKEFIDYLKAQRIAYSQCKFYQIFDLISILLAIILPIIGLFKTNLVNYLGAFGVLWTIVYLIAENFRKIKSEQGAKIQEQFDTELYQVPWNEVLCRDKVNRDIQRDLITKYNKNDLKDWYSVEIGNTLPHEIAVLLCQRINFSWELNLRKKFVFFLVGVIVIYYGIFLLISILSNLGLFDTLILMAPSISFLIYGVQNSLSLKSQIKSKTQGLDLIDKKLEDFANNNTLPTIEILRQIQDVIYIERTVPEKIPDWFYKAFRTRNEIRTDDLIKSIKNTL